MSTFKGTNYIRPEQPLGRIELVFNTPTLAFAGGLGGNAYGRPSSVTVISLTIEEAEALLASLTTDIAQAKGSPS